VSVLVKHNSKLWGRQSDSGETFLIWCPGCKCGHSIPTPRWTFDPQSSVECPTFTPSVRLFIPAQPATDEDPAQPERTICHFNVTSGKLILHADCQHDMNGQTIDMVDIPADYGF
jgi:hypothetical protein